MATRDETLVTITLDRQRPYRVNETDRHAVWVGPGEVQVPAWVAQEWNKPRPVEPVATPYNGSNLQRAIIEASDEELIAIPGIGEKSVEALRAWAKGEQQPEAQAQTPQEGGEGEPPITVETVNEKPLETVETVEIVDADAERAIPRRSPRNRNA